MKLKEVIKLYSFEGFFQAYMSEKKKCQYGWQAFEYINGEFERYFGKPRYKDWDSFRAVWNRKIRQGKLPRT